MEDRTHSEEIELTVCICTFRRPSVLSTIDSVDRQSALMNRHVRILIIDNDSEPTALKIATEFRSRTNIPVDYKHVPGQNISTARNAGLDTATTPWLAFVDDDEYVRHLLGSALLVFLPPAVTNIGIGAGLDGTQAAQLAPFVYGVVLVLVMLLAPSGAVGVTKKLWNRSRKNRRGPSTPLHSAQDDTRGGRSDPRPADRVSRQSSRGRDDRYVSRNESTDGR